MIQSPRTEFHSQGRSPQWKNQCGQTATWGQMSDSVPRQTDSLQEDDASLIWTQEARLEAEPRVSKRKRKPILDSTLVTLAEIIKEAVDEHHCGIQCEEIIIIKSQPNISSNHPNQNTEESQLANGFDNQVVGTRVIEQMSSVPSSPGTEQPVPAVLSSEPASNNVDESLLPNVPMALPNSPSRRLSSPNSENNPKQSVPPTPEEMQQSLQEEPKRSQTNRTPSLRSLNLSDLFHEDSEQENRMKKLGKWTRCKSAFNGFLKQITSCFRRQKAIEELLQ